jgi:methylenetetrahydrofolate reductase (NADPH)
VFINWGRQVRAAGIKIPIVPGIMPIQTFASFKRRTAFSKTIVPQVLWDLLEPIQEDDIKVREVGTKFVGEMCRKVLSAGIGINGVHICEFCGRWSVGKREGAGGGRLIGPRLYRQTR